MGVVVRARIVLVKVVEERRELILDPVERALEVGGEVPRERRSLSTVPRRAQEPWLGLGEPILLHGGLVGRYLFTLSRGPLPRARDGA